VRKVHKAFKAQLESKALQVYKEALERKELLAHKESKALQEFKALQEYKAY
jgi:hypothetical protein